MTTATEIPSLKGINARVDTEELLEGRMRRSLRRRRSKHERVREHRTGRRLAKLALATVGVTIATAGAVEILRNGVDQLETQTKSQVDYLEKNKK